MSREFRIWAIYDYEGKVIGIAKAKTSGGARRKYEEDSGGHRDEIYVEPIQLNENGYCSFPVLR
jgi:hypothetical protein